MFTIRGTKEESVELRWLAKAQSKNDNQPVLESFHRLGNLTMTADGFRLHVIPTPACLAELPNTNGDAQANYTGRIPTGGFVADVEGHEGYYPNVEVLLPTGAPTVEIAINPKLLREALDGMEEPVIIRQYTNPGCITVHGVGDQRRYALIMQMHLDKVGMGWQPNFPKEEAKEWQSKSLS